MVVNSAAKRVPSGRAISASPDAGRPARRAASGEGRPVSAIGRPAIDSALRPSMRAAAGFTNRARPSGPALTMPSPAEERIRSCRSWSRASSPRAVRSRPSDSTNSRVTTPANSSPPTAIAVGTSFEEPPMPPTATARWRPATSIPARCGGAVAGPASSTRTVTPGGRSAAAARANAGTETVALTKPRRAARRSAGVASRAPARYTGATITALMPPLASIGADSRVSWPSRAAASTAAASALPRGSPAASPLISATAGGPSTGPSLHATARRAGCRPSIAAVKRSKSAAVTPDVELEVGAEVVDRVPGGLHLGRQRAHGAPGDRVAVPLGIAVRVADRRGGRQRRRHQDRRDGGDAQPCDRPSPQAPLHP